MRGHLTCARGDDAGPFACERGADWQLPLAEAIRTKLGPLRPTDFLLSFGWPGALSKDRPGSRRVWARSPEKAALARDVIQAARATGARVFIRTPPGRARPTDDFERQNEVKLDADATELRAVAGTVNDTRLFDAHALIQSLRRARHEEGDTADGIDTHDVWVDRLHLQGWLIAELVSVFLHLVSETSRTNE